MLTVSLLLAVSTRIASGSSQYGDPAGRLPPPPSGAGNAVAQPPPPPRYPQQQQPPAQQWPPMQQAPANVPVKTFRVVTTASAGAVYALLAWRTHTSFGQNPVTNSIVGANLVACCIAFSRVRGHKRLLKSVLITDIGLEAILFLSSAWNLFFPSKNLTNKDFEFASLISSIWFVLIALTCLRSNWIVAPPASSSTDSQSSSYRPHHHSMPPTRTPPY